MENKEKCKNCTCDNNISPDFDYQSQELNIEQQKLDLLQKKNNTYEEICKIGVFDKDYIQKIIFGKEVKKIFKKQIK